MNATEIRFPDGYEPSWMEGMLCAKRIDNGEWLTVIPLTGGRARLCVAEEGPTGSASLEHWCMDNVAIALGWWAAWPHPPLLWNRHQRRDLLLEWPCKACGQVRLQDADGVCPPCPCGAKP